MAEEHRALRESYVTELRAAREIAETWWSRIVAEEPGKSLKDKTESAKRRWPDGAPSHPSVIGVFQKYVHECEELNKTLERHQQVPVNRFAIDWLETESLQDVSDFLQLTYWPLGDDDEGNLV